MDTPPSMRDELASWNNGAGIDLEGWISGSGNFELAIGYATLFWPRFVEIDGFIVREGVTRERLQEWAASPRVTRRGVEVMVNHFHLADLHMHATDAVSEDKLAVLGETLREIYAAKLAWQFPHSPCIVAFDRPEPGGDLVDFQITFWQARHTDVD
jgi:hypothetical protein